MMVFPRVVFLATDGSDDARLAERAAVGLCGRTGARLHVVHTRIAVPIGA